MKIAKTETHKRRPNRYFVGHMQKQTGLHSTSTHYFGFAHYFYPRGTVIQTSGDRFEPHLDIFI